MNILQIALVPWVGRTPDSSAYTLRLLDFLIDGRSLAEYLGVSRSGLDLCRSPLEYAGQARYRAALMEYTQQLTGAALGWNQFGSERVVLYGCHCGCDYCGVISARVERSRGVVRWLDIGYEDERGARGTTAFAFRVRQVAAAVTGLLRRSRGAGTRGAGGGQATS